MKDVQADTPIYRAVINHEEQYSIWPRDKELPNGWQDAGREGTKEEVLAFIAQVWRDMRPRSLREAMEANKAR